MLTWIQNRPALVLSAATLLLLLPFVGRAFHIDDPLFVWSAQHIVHHPGDPFGAEVIWDVTRTPMSEITKNPPLACYYAAVAGSVAGWSEWALHLAFVLPALAVVLGTYRLARRFTKSPLAAAAATLLTPGFLVSASSVMCDTMMLALWIWAVVFWMEGLELLKPGCLFVAGLLISASALTKYFGICLLPLLLAYSWTRHHRFGAWIWYLLVPVVAVTGYQAWTHALYGHGMFLDAVRFAPAQRASIGQTSLFTNFLVGLSFAGGCALPALALAPLVWPRKHALIGLLISALAGAALALGWISLGGSPQAELVAKSIHEQWPAVALQLALMIAGGISVLALAVADAWKNRDATSILLLLWVLGTFCFAAFLNWTINARSILPLVPAVAILLARQLDKQRAPSPAFYKKIAFGLALAGLVSFWVALGDAGLANTARDAATLVKKSQGETPGQIWFQGHWGFQYYMEQVGMQPVDFERSVLKSGDLLVLPENNIQTFRLPEELIASAQVMEIRMPQPVTTNRWSMGAGFYFSFFGPLPFAFGDVPPERYFLFRLSAPMGPGQWPGLASSQSK